jgi:hypothetical protein
MPTIIDEDRYLGIRKLVCINGLLVGIAFVIGPPLHRKARAVLFALVEISTKVSGMFNPHPWNRQHSNN